MKKDGFCAFCYSPASHEGGFEFEGQPIIETFCSKECFDLWVQWKVNFLEWMNK